MPNLFADQTQHGFKSAKKLKFDSADTPHEEAPLDQTNNNPFSRPSTGDVLPFSTRGFSNLMNLNSQIPFETVDEDMREDDLDGGRSVPSSNHSSNTFNNLFLNLPVSQLKSDFLNQKQFSFNENT
jgi:hypothetical protein